LREAAQAPRRQLLSYAAFIIVGLVVGAAAVYGIDPVREVPGPTVTLTETATQTVTVTLTETVSPTSTDEKPCLPLHPHSLVQFNLNISDMKKAPTSFRIQSRSYPDEFNLWDYPPGLWGSRFDAELFREVGFKRSYGIEVSTEDSNICSVVLEFENCSGARESYYQFLDFLSNRSKYDCAPYVTIPRWHQVADMLDHFRGPTQEYIVTTEIPSLADQASWLYDAQNDFFFVVAFSRNILFLVGETGSLDGAIEYAWVLESKIR